MGFTSANSCCCIDLRTGGLILGYSDLVYTVFLLVVTFGHKSHVFAYALFLGFITVAWLYGIHENKHIFMLPNLIWAIVTNIIVCSFFVSVSFASLFGSRMIDWANEKIHSSISYYVGFGNAFNAHVNSPNTDSNSAAAASSAGGIIFFIWLAFAIFTAFSFYFTVVMISLYNRMKAKSLALPSMARGGHFNGIHINK